MSKLKRIFHLNGIKAQNTHLPTPRRQKIENKILQKALIKRNIEGDILLDYLSFLNISQLKKTFLKNNLRPVFRDWIRGITYLHPFNHKTPIREPIIPDKREKKNEERKSDKKLIIPVNREENNLELWPIGENYTRNIKKFTRNLNKVKNKTVSIIKNNQILKMNKFTSINEMIRGIPSYIEARYIENKVLKRKSVKTDGKSSNLSVKGNNTSFLIDEKTRKKPEERTNMSVMSDNEKLTMINQWKSALENILFSVNSRKFILFNSDKRIPQGLSSNKKLIAWQNDTERSKIIELNCKKIQSKPQKIIISSKLSQTKPNIKTVKLYNIIFDKRKFKNQVNRDFFISNNVIAHENLIKSTNYIAIRNFYTTTYTLSINSSIIHKNSSKSLTTNLINKTLSLSEMTRINSIDLKNQDIDWNLINYNQQKKNISQMENSMEIKTERSLLPVEILTLVTTDSNDMSFYNAQIVKELDKIYGRKIDIVLTPSNKIGDNIMDAPLPIKISISMKSTSKDMENSVNWISSLCQSDFPTQHNNSFNIMNNSFGDGFSDDSGSSKSRRIRDFIINSEEYESGERKSLEIIGNKNLSAKSEAYELSEDYVRVPGDPYPYSQEHFRKWRVSRKSSTSDILPKEEEEEEQNDIINVPGDFHITKERPNKIDYDRYSGSELPQIETKSISDEPHNTIIEESMKFPSDKITEMIAANEISRDGINMKMKFMQKKYEFLHEEVPESGISAEKTSDENSEIFKN